MLKFIFGTTIIAAAGLASAGIAAAVPTGGSAADAVASLQGQGYSVQLNGRANGPLTRCVVTGIHGLTGTTASMDVLMSMTNPAEFGTAYVDIDCPSGSS